MEIGLVICPCLFDLTEKQSDSEFKVLEFKAAAGEAPDG